jgi:cell shape-determining protein MreD
MTILFYILVSLCLLVIKTSLTPGLLFFGKFYDLLIPIVIYLSLFRALREGIPIVLFFGLIMDSLCGAPMGLYIATYVWLYVAMRYLRQVLHAGNIVLFAVAVAGGVAFESVILLVYMLVLAHDTIVWADAANITTRHIAWALITGPILMVMISWAQKRIDILRKKIFPDFLDSNGA